MSPGAAAGKGRSHVELRAIFEQYVFGFIQSDIERELWLARKAEHDKLHGRYPGPHPGGGNVLAALGLMCFVEFVGSLIAPEAPTYELKFMAMLPKMGSCYVEFAASHKKKPTTFDIFRNELAHRYSVDRNLDVFMLKSRESCGFGFDDFTKRYYIVVERVFEDFLRASRGIYADLG